ncbi:MAG: metG [Parcubacteria group bacterium]|nr:metG [Parcubacteria group bacterium]
MSARYITTTLPYVNSDPHIGFAAEVLQADAFSRTWRLNGDEVFFNTGTDEHGQKILQSADKAGQDVHDYVDYYAAEFRKLHEALDLSNDAFIRTTDEAHMQAAEEMWRRCEAKGDIYKKAYTGLYCVGCEAFKTEKEIVDGHCAIHTNLTPEEITEENYFFKFSNYQKQLLDYLKGENVIVPEWRRQEAIAFAENGLEDFSISREKARLSWGVPVPGDETQVMYVWFDALTNYISTLGWPTDPEGKFKKYWEDGRVLQLAGKDQVRFQSLMWQAMLMSADIKTTNTVFYHGFINAAGGQKMSKSLGNVINPLELVDKYGTEATRFLLLRNIHPYDDTDITWERLDEWYTADLVNGIGNLTARILQMAETHLSAPVSLPNFDFKQEYESVLLDRKIPEFRIDEIVDQIAVIDVQALDARITKDRPFNLVKEDLEAGQALITELVIGLSRVVRLLTPFMPSTSDKILQAIKENKKPENLFPRLPVQVGLV